jgi:hypothetical protein
MKKSILFAAAFVFASGFVATASAHFVHNYGTDPGNYDYAINGEYPDLFHDNPDNSGSQQGFLYTYRGCDRGGSTSAPRSITTLATRDSCKADFDGQYRHAGHHHHHRAHEYSNGTAH